MTAVRQRSVQPSDADLRLDRWFKQHFPGVTHARLQKWLRTGQVRVDGKRAKASVRLVPGQVIRVPPGADDRPPDAKKSSAPSQAVGEADRAALLEAVLYRDDDVIVIDKPPGLAVQGGSKTRRHLDGMLDVLRFDAKEKPRLVHRLDKDTSGVLVLARTRQSAAYLTRAFRTRDVHKLYWAIVVGVPKLKSGVIEAALVKGKRPDGERMAADPEGGKAAKTIYRVIDHAGRRAAWLELEPLTGRTHQLRIHCAEIGTPILGDGKYGGGGAFLDGIMAARKIHLHARAISLPSADGRTISIEAPLPDYMAETWRSLGFDFAPNKGI
jgi:23S rRNA pseudouridine955/2504/2580 synthase